MAAYHQAVALSEIGLASLVADRVRREYPDEMADMVMRITIIADTVARYRASKRAESGAGHPEALADEFQRARRRVRGT